CPVAATPYRAYNGSNRRPGKRERHPGTAARTVVRLSVSPTRQKQVGTLSGKSFAPNAPAARTEGPEYVSGTRQQLLGT
ncbi:hypothetical protein, partial [Enterobacter intestinihominis]